MAPLTAPAPDLDDDCPTEEELDALLADAPESPAWDDEHAAAVLAAAGYDPARGDEIPW